MTLKQFELTDIEKQFKKLYYDQGEKYLSRAMTLTDYQQLPENRKILSEDTLKYHEINSSAQDVNTIRDTREENDENLIDINVHGRYSYPLMHNHHYIELVYVYSGNCTQFIEDHTFTLNTGDFCILAPNTVHAISASSDDAIVLDIMVSQVFFGSTFLKMLRQNPAIVSFFENILYDTSIIPYILYPTGDDKWMHETFEWMFSVNKTKNYLFQEEMALYVRHIFVHLLRYYEMDAIIANPMNRSQENNVVALISYITMNYDHITLQSTADFFGYNLSYLCQLLKKCTGKTFTEMVNNARINDAKDMLANTSLPVTEIGLKVGCYDASHFTRVFKNQVGVTPNQYRKQQQKSPE